MYKKLIFLLSAILIISCNSDNDSPINDDSSNNPTIPVPTTTKVLVSKTTQYTNQGVIINRFIYRNNKLISVGNNQMTNKVEFVYEGDKIVRSNSINNNVFLGYDTMTYDGNNLMSVIASDNEQRFDFAYNNDILTSNTYSIKYGNNWTQINKNVYTFFNGNAIQKINYATSPTRNIVSKSTYLFDSKNNPMRDMPTYIKLIFNLEEFSPLNLNNFISQESFDTLEATIPSKEYEYDIIYNNKDFPIQISKRLKGSSDPISKTVIQYL